jgi:hypothetical protein
MARKYSKGKKPEETMRQRQMRLLKEQQARKAAKPTVKSTPDSNPAKRGAQGPRNPDPQGPRQRVSGLQGSRTKPTTAKAPPTQKYKPRVSNVGLQIRQADNVRSNQINRDNRLQVKAGKIPANETPGQRIRRTGGSYRGMKYPGGGKPGVRIGAGARRGTGKKGGIGDIKTTLTGGLVTAAAVGSLRNPITKAKAKAKPNRKEGQKATLNGKPVVWRKGKWVPAPGRNAGNYNTRDADGTVRSRKKVGPKKVGPKKVGPKKVGTIAQAFDKSYAAAKKAGKKTFMFRGKKYTTN